MSEKLTELRCDEFVAQLGSDAPVPGGGSASGLVAALATALANMVGHLTVGKKKYAEVEEEIQTLMKRCDALEKEMLAMAEKDAEAFRPLSAAYRMPEDTPEQAEEKARVMEEVLAEATYAPLEIVRGCREVIEICDAFAHKGSRLAVSEKRQKN
jgi:formiminotetrahydrofolate cyclodeaminase